MKKNVLVCIPAYNEAESIGRVLDDILRLHMRTLFDILVVNDGSSDDTEGICRGRGVNVVTHVFNTGYGAALKTAYKYALQNGYEYLIQLDADGQHDPINIERIYNKLTDGENPPDIVMGSRFLRDSMTFPDHLPKRIVVSVIRAVIKMATGHHITDPTTGLQGLNLRAFSYYSRYNNFDTSYPDANMVIQMLLNDFTVEEIPSVMHPRQSGKSMHSGFYKPIKYVVKMTLSILSTWLRETAEARRRKSMKRKASNAIPVRAAVLSTEAAEMEKTAGGKR